MNTHRFDAVVVGSGTSAYYCATALNEAGRSVAVVDERPFGGTCALRGCQPKKYFVANAVQVLLEAVAAAGIRFVPNEEPVAVTKTNRGLEVRGESGVAYVADCVIEATGRTPNLGVLAGDAHGVEATATGITVNAQLQSVSNPRVYVIGDVAATGFQLATVAYQSGMLVAENILNGNCVTLDTSVVASAVFTVPNLQPRTTK